MKRDSKPGKLPKAPFENSDIYRDAQKVLVNTNIITSRMKKEYRLVTGNMLCDRALVQAEAAALAYMEKDPRLKIARIRRLVRACAGVYALHRVAKSVNVCSDDLYEDQLEACIGILLRAQAWMHDCQNKITETDFNQPQDGPASHGACKQTRAVPTSSDTSPQSGQGRQKAPARTGTAPQKAMRVRA